MTKKIFLVCVVVVVVPVIAYVSARGVAAWRKGFSWTEMDWNRDGWTSPGEFLRSSDIGVRYEDQGGKTCVVYFAYKDALPVKTDCESFQEEENETDLSASIGVNFARQTPLS